MDKKLYRSKTEVKVSGVCGGIAVYFGFDVTVVRLVWALGTLFTGGFMGVIAYIICAMIIPVEPNYYDVQFKEKEL